MGPGDEEFYDYLTPEWHRDPSHFFDTVSNVARLRQLQRRELCTFAIKDDDVEAFKQTFTACDLGYDGAWEHIQQHKAVKVKAYLVRHFGLRSSDVHDLLRRRDFATLEAALKSRGYPEGVEIAVADLLERGSFTQAKQLIDMREAPLRVVRVWVERAAGAATSKGLGYIMKRLKPTDVHLEMALGIALEKRRKTSARRLVEYGVPVSHQNIAQAIEADDTFVLDSALASEPKEYITSLLPGVIKSAVSDRAVLSLLKRGVKVTAEDFHEAIVAGRGSILKTLAAKVEDEDMKDVCTVGLTLAVCGREEPAWDMVQTLSDMGADPSEGLSLAVLKDNYNFTRHFLSKGASVAGVSTDKASKKIQKLFRENSSTLWDHLFED